MPNEATLLPKLLLLFPHLKPKVNARKETQIRFESQHYAELDIWFEELGLALEFQDDYHYVTTWYNQHPRHTIAERDYTKSELVRQDELTLVTIPCWWDNALGSLQSSINFFAPHVIPPSTAPPIPLNPQVGFFQSDIPQIGELSRVSFVLNSTAISNNQWWSSKKYDGVRFLSRKKKIFTRFNMQLLLKSEIHEILPPTVAEGEIWFGRGNYSLVNTLVNANEFAFYDLFRMIFFDIPLRSLHDAPYELRYKLLLPYVPEDHPFGIVPSRLLLPNKRVLYMHLQSIAGDTGEGLILQKTQSTYEQGRSQSLLKFKLHADDREAIVENVEANGVHCKLPSGAVFFVREDNIALPEDQAKQGLSVGNIVSFSCSGFTNKHLPMDPTIYRIRQDLDWDDVLRTKQQRLSASPVLEIDSKAKMRAFLEKFVSGLLLNPKDPATWYDVTEQELQTTKTGYKIIQHFKSLENAVTMLFPEIAFDFDTNSRGTEKNRKRILLEKFAAEYGFDPHNAENWYNLSTATLQKFPNIAKIARKHNHNYKEMLADSFPEIQFEPSLLFSGKGRDGKWTDAKNRKQLLITYANANHFDPTDPECWYQQSRTNIAQFPGVISMIEHHKKSIKQALLDLFPDIGLQESQFARYSMWRDNKNVRKLFLDYAKIFQFDPLLASNWYKQSTQNILQFPGVRAMQHVRGKSIAKALLCAFPDIGLQRKGFLDSMT
eukprot:Phypoly_transcript_02851.p1 GENE.Phypoly_transcript_02851~~Phypoly_transcript_02851.p1  ORF type:complete len:717 (+),score=103.58 Phypoly_transcript_02851:98-2248(+)